MRKISLLFGAITLFALPMLASAHDLHTSKEALTALDTDHEGSLDWNEVKPAVVMHWHSLNAEGPATSSEKTTHESNRQVTNLLAAERIKHINPDHDGSLSLSDYLAIARYRFFHADLNKDGKIDDDEINSVEGRDLLRMMQNPRIAVH